ncbi:hypothetical protein DWB79_11610 [Treponema medium]|uniref:Uncharacterized protein n=2 Tax=Treponema medium TaxID=58231 RepID=A0AA87NNF5_TREMD|nr:hypothetical protein [Treponema medium]EPF27785.1 hypothetical protein HMPREF9195_02286 [Treponema medium ATCC 700293]QSH98380.1 hypothetical protein DWB79_11610 [Treponema medium]
MNKRLRCIAFLVLCMMTAAQMPLIAEEKKEDHTPVPYTKEEFPLWQRELRRFEILSFGALPFVTLLSFWGYDMIRAIQHPKDPAYYPWPLKQADKAVALTEKEQLGVFLTAAGISVTIALIDITYRAIKRSAAKKRLERENAFTEDPIQFTPIKQSDEEDAQALKLMTDAALAAGSIGGIATLLEKEITANPSLQDGKTGSAAQ